MYCTKKLKYLTVLFITFPETRQRQISSTTMDSSSMSATEYSRSCVGTVISFTKPPPVGLRNTLVARTVESAAPFLRACISDGGRVSYEIVSPSAADLFLFALIESSKNFLGSRDALSSMVDAISKSLGPCHWESHDHECDICKETTTSKALFFKLRDSRNRSHCRSRSRLSFTKCSNPDCDCSHAPPILRTLIANQSHTYKASCLERVLCTRLALAVEAFRSTQLAEFGCVVDPQKKKVVQHGFASDMALLADSTLDYMYSLNSNIDFSPDFASKDMRRLYEAHARLLSWDFPMTTMIYVPPVNRQPPLHNFVSKKFIERHTGEAIVNGSNTYMVCTPDRVQAGAVCDLYFSDKYRPNITLSLFWRWPITIPNNYTEGFWYDPHSGRLAAPVPQGITVCKSLSDFTSKMKTNLTTNFVVVNAQELDFIMMKMLLQAIIKTGSCCHFMGLMQPVGVIKEARMNGRPFLFFCWWNHIKPVLPSRTRYTFKVATPPLDASISELAVALQHATVDKDHEAIAERAAECWHFTHWPGVEYTVTSPPPRVHHIGSYKMHSTDSDRICMRSCNNAFSVKVTTKSSAAIGEIRKGDWAHIVRFSAWAPVPTHIVQSGLKWKITDLPAASFSKALHVFAAVDAESFKGLAVRMKLALSKIGVFLTAAITGITRDIANTLRDLAGRDHILVPENPNTDAAVSIGLDCYLAAVGAPSPTKFVRVRDKLIYTHTCTQFREYLSKAAACSPKSLRGTIKEIDSIFCKFNTPKEEDRPKKKKRIL